MPIVSFQLYSARNFFPLERVLATLAGLGYRHVEPYGGLLADAQGFAAALKAAGLAAPTCHIGAPQLREDLPRWLGALKAVGVTTAFVPAVPPEERSHPAARWTALGQELEGYRKRFADEGIRLGWHNHAFEFARTETGALPLDLIFEAAPDLLWQADIGWIVRAKEDPVAWLGKYAGRVVAAHIKDVAPEGENAQEDGWADVGHGTVDWAPIRAALAKTGCEVFTLEHDNPADADRFARRSFATVSAW